MVELIEAELYIEKEKQFRPHTCGDWMPIAEDGNWDKGTDLINTMFYDSLMRENPQVYSDVKRSLEFFSKFDIPETSKVVLKKKPGCMVCHNDFVESKIHYALLKGYCDIKTIQYYLFEKGIMYRAWVLKEHMKHIDIQDIKPKTKLFISDFKIINDEIQALRQEIEDLKGLGNVTDNLELGKKRQLMMDLIEKKNKMTFDIDDSDNYVKLDDVMKRLK